MFLEASPKTGFNAQKIFIEAGKLLYSDYKYKISQGGEKNLKKTFFSKQKKNKEKQNHEISSINEEQNKQSLEFIKLKKYINF